MHVLLFDVLKHLLLRKTVALKTYRNKIWRNAVALKTKTVQAVFGKTFILALLSSPVFLSNCFVWEIKAFIRVS